MSWISRSKCSRPWRAWLSNAESVQLKLRNTWSHESWLSCEFSRSSFYKAIRPWNKRFCIGVCWFSSPGSWGVGSQYLCLESSHLGIFYIAFTYWTASSWFVSERWRNSAPLTCFIKFVCSGTSVQNVAMWYLLYSVNGCSKYLLISAVNCLFWMVLNTGQMMKSSLSSRSREGWIRPVTSFST